MREEKRQSFGKISDAFNTDYQESDNCEVETKLKKFEERKNKLVAKISSDTDLEDVEYMRFELKSLIAGGLRILEKLDEDIKIGSKVRSHEVYFSGVNSIRDTLKELRELNRTIVDIKHEEKKISKGIQQNNLTINQFLDSKQLLSMIDDVQKNNSMNEIKAEFYISDNDSKVSQSRITESKEQSL